MRGITRGNEDADRRAYIYRRATILDLATIQSNDLMLVGSGAMSILLSKVQNHSALRLLGRAAFRCLLQPKICLRQSSSTPVPSDEKNPEKTRNIGIIAHIDAGKTTTTERMLYYSGYTHRIGDVDDGSTVTDFLPAERARGITIQSAAVTFQWPPRPADAGHHTSSHTINLIDTPGHADFTFEVVRSLRILDGAVCILDGVAGVEAQTEKVWAQANKYSIPRIVLINKLDRDGAAFAQAVHEVGARLKGFPAVCQIPWWEGGKGKFVGLGDVVNLCGLKWISEDGTKVQRFTLDDLEQEDAGLKNHLFQAREALVSVLCSYDEKLLEVWMDCNDDCLAVPGHAIRASLRRCILDGSASVIPVFAGASLKNIGVQPLLDAVNDLLPNPSERPDAEIHVGSDQGGLLQLLGGRMDISSLSSNGQITKKVPIPTSLSQRIEGCALAFKVVNDSKRGVLVYIRVYSGTIDRNVNLWNTNLQVVERAQRLLRMYASDAVEISSISAGQIGVIAGSKYARTGDTLISYKGLNVKNGPPAPLHNLQLRPIEVPPPVFFASIAPKSLSEQKEVEEKLALLLREDPSLNVQVNEETGQTLLSGMGELHLEIARDRLVNDFKAKATMGNIEISYRECVLAPSTMQRAMFDRELQGKKGKAGCEAMVQPLSEEIVQSKQQPFLQNGNAVTIRFKGSSEPNTLRDASIAMALSTRAVQKALLNGALAGLARGPRRAYSLHSTHVVVEFDPVQDYFGIDSTAPIISTAARMAVQKALQAAHKSGDVCFLEPVMDVVIACDESSLGNIIHDLSSARGGHVLSLEDGSPSASDDARGSDINLKDIYAPPDPFAPHGGGSTTLPSRSRQVIAKVPLKEMVGYLKHLRSMTSGRGTFLMNVADWQKVTGLREKAL